MSVHSYGPRPITATGVALAVLAALFLSTSPARAQSPYPNRAFLDRVPGNHSFSEDGVVVEGETVGCGAYSLAQVESDTVYYLNNNKVTITEVSLLANCNTVAGYEQMFRDIVNYVEAYAPNIAPQHWGGIMVDEESQWGFTPSNLQHINQSLYDTMVNTPGLSWYFTEVFSGSGDWSPLDYLNITSGSYQTSQISTDYMVYLVNGDNHGRDENVVTWSAEYPCPYCTESYAVGKINNPPYEIDFGYPGPFYWSNHFV